MKYQITHLTQYNYNLPVSYAHNVAHLIPRATDYQRCLSYELSILPQPEGVEVHTDVFGNQIAYFSLHTRHKEFSVKSSSVVELDAYAIPDTIPGDPPLADVRKAMHAAADQNTRMAKEFMLDSPFIQRDSKVYAQFAEILDDQRPIYEALHDLMRWIFTEYEYDPHFSDMATPLADVVKHKRGVCQDFAHLAIAALRSFGLAARYVSGYLETLPPPGTEKLQGADESHAWFSVYIPEFGWFDFDPTNNVVPIGQHVTVAWGRDYSDVPPLKGILFGGGDHKLKVSVDMERVQEKAP